MSQIRRRKKYFVKPGFQSRLTAIFILIVIIVANIVGALVYGFSVSQLEDRLVKESKLPLDSNQLGQALLPGVILAELISIFVVAFICIFVTHTIAGPVYRMERVTHSIGEGDLTNFIKLRPKDELKDLADSMNEMTMGLRNKVILFKETTDKIKAGIEIAKNTKKTDNLDDVLEAVQSMKAALESFTLEKERRSKKTEEIDDIDEIDEVDTDLQEEEEEEKA